MGTRLPLVNQVGTSGPPLAHDQREAEICMARAERLRVTLSGDYRREMNQAGQTPAGL